MVYDARADRVILFGGRSGNVLLNDTWAYDLTNDTWTNLTPPVGPSPRVWPQMAYANASGRVLLFSGEDDPYRLEGAEDFWAYDYASNTWSNLTPAALPPSRFWGNMAYDTAAAQMVLFGGLHNRPTIGWMPLLNDTWTYDDRHDVWSEEPPTQALNLSAPGGMVYDSRDGVVLLYRGLATSYDEWSGGTYVANETWRYPGAGETWTRLSTRGQVVHRWGVGMVYDAQADKTILFGGCSRFLGPPCFSGTWAYEASNAMWADVSGGQAPSPRASPSMAYARDGMTVLFGGGIPSGIGSAVPYNDTWVYVCGLHAVPALSVQVVASPPSGVSPLQVTFASAVSGGSPPYAYSWDFGDRSQSSESQPVHSYVTAGLYTVTLVVCDAGGRSLTKTLNVAVGQVSSPPSGLGLGGLALAAAVIVALAGLVLWLVRRSKRGD